MDWMALLNSLLEIVLPALGSLLVVWFGILGAKMKTAYEKKVNTETKKEVVQLTVEYVQQVYKALDGESKLQKAIEQATLLLNEKGITISEIELRTLIESAVYGLKQGFTETITETLTEEQAPMLEQQSSEEA